MFLGPWRPNLVNYNVSAPFGAFPGVLQCFLVFGARAVDPLVEVYPRTFRGIGFTLSPLPPFPVEALSRRMLKNMQNITENTHHRKNHAFYLCFRSAPPSRSRVNHYFSRVLLCFCALAPKPCKLQRFWSIWAFPSCLTVFLGLGRPCPVNYNVSVPFWNLLCFIVFRSFGCPCPVN